MRTLTAYALLPTILGLVGALTFAVVTAEGSTLLGGTVTEGTVIEDAGNEVKQLTAEETAQQSVEALLARAKELKPFYETNKERYHAELAKQLETFVDFDAVARGVMAKYGVGPKGASDEQKRRFSGVFKQSLVRFYAGALASYGGEKIKFRKSKKKPRNPHRATTVRMSIISEDSVGSGSSQYELHYVMFLATEGESAGEWRLKNLYIEGINLRRQYHSQFAALMKKNHNDIDKVIDSWNSQ